MSRHSLVMSLVVLVGLCMAHEASAQLARPGGPLVCHKQVCPVPASSCQVREQEGCVKGGGPPRCPAIVNVADGTSCSDGSLCTSGDVCTAGTCGGTTITCSGATDVCTPLAGCATPCGPAGCTVSASDGYLNPTLTVPPDALAAPVSITMRDQGGDPNDSKVFHVYSFGPNGTTFAKPATVDLPAPPLAAGESAVIEVSDDGINWTPVATTAANGRVSGPIAHFSSCSTRAFVPQAAAPSVLIVTDIVDYQDLAQVKAGGLVIPNSAPNSCYSGDLYGVCFKIKNDSLPGTAPITSTCPPPPTPTNPPPAGCVQMHVVPWQCYTAYRDYPGPFDPNNADAYEGQHCDNTGLLIPCADSVYNLDSFLPAGGLAPGQEVWADLNFAVNPVQPASGPYPYQCFGSSFIGVDLLFREPSGNCAPGGTCDWQAGIRSAKEGPLVAIANGTHFYLPAGVSGCTPPAGQSTCEVICTSSTCNVKWEWLVNRAPANYPQLHCVRNGTDDCSQFQPSDVVIKNWLNDARF
jgi:hypothetical protein